VRVWLGILLVAFCSLVQAEIWRFGLIGDVPYSDYERRELPHMLKAINDSQVTFIAHVGDFKHGKDRCDDAVFEDRHQLFNSSQTAFIFVPGDNEWTDCERLSNGAYEPLERLDKLRSLFWKDSFSLGNKKLAVERQAGSYREHSRFRVGPVLFVTLNLPGGNNNFGLTDEPQREYQARNPFVLAWLKDSFALARREKLAGIALLFQANPGFKHFAQGLPHRGYRDFLNTLYEETQRFPGQVLAMHGDTHQSRIDHPLRDAEGKRLANFTRVETFGYPAMGWTRGIIDTNSPSLFSFETYPWPAKTQ
jgi:hypothetical protein